METLPNYRIAYVRQVGPYGPAESAILLGIPQDNPQTTPPEKCRYDACIVIAAWAEIFPTLHKMGFHIDNKPILEKYTGNMVNNDFCEICVPIKRL
ncbi:hypothetical protein ACFQ5D_00200 [Paenibacillus farraposensis]|uniref:GyrI-like small molecule binding domain-containing protein n=1 Tax=Paenibacillus farraposensis TaxID=2807095 RepID=A0ABW4D986_9BACL|nr:hypothetical protein [Paenibacillus farraposensis]